MNADVEARIASALAQMRQDHAAFERRVAEAYERLFTERQQLATGHKQLLSDRAHLVQVGRKLRRRWRQQKLKANRELQARQCALSAWGARLQIQSVRQNECLARLCVMQEIAAHQQTHLDTVHEQQEAARAQIADERRALEQDRAQAEQLRAQVESEQCSLETRRQQLQDELAGLENRITNLRQHLRELEQLRHADEPEPPLPPDRFNRAA